MFPRANGLPALWFSSKGCALGADAIYGLVCRRTKTAFGFGLNPHAFRAIVATAIGREAPGKIAIARDLLTHAKLSTTVRYYTKAQTVQAGREHSALIARLRRGDKPRRSLGRADDGIDGDNKSATLARGPQEEKV
jgi:hypothetical protein